MFRNCCRDVIQVKENVKCSKVSHEVSFAAVSETEIGNVVELFINERPEVEYGINGVVQIRSRGVDSHGDGSLPSLQERLQVIKKCKITMGCVGDGLVTVELPSSSDVVIENPEPGPDTLQCHNRGKVNNIKGYFFLT